MQNFLLELEEQKSGAVGLLQPNDRVLRKGGYSLLVVWQKRQNRGVLAKKQLRQEIKIAVKRQRWKNWCKNSRGSLQVLPLVGSFLF